MRFVLNTKSRACPRVNNERRPLHFPTVVVQSTDGFGLCTAHRFLCRNIFKRHPQCTQLASDHQHVKCSPKHRQCPFGHNVIIILDCRPRLLIYKPLAQIYSYSANETWDLLRERTTHAPSHNPFSGAANTFSCNYTERDLPLRRRRRRRSNNQESATEKSFVRFGPRTWPSG